MALVKNQKLHAIDVAEGQLGPGEIKNVNVANPYNAQLLAEGIIVVTDGTVAPPSSDVSVVIQEVIVSQSPPPPDLARGILYFHVNSSNGIVDIGLGV